MRQVQRRLSELERAATDGGQDDPPWAVVIYDGATGEPLQPVPPGAVFQVWLPAKRHEVSGETDTQTLAGRKQCNIMARNKSGER